MEKNVKSKQTIVNKGKKGWIPENINHHIYVASKETDYNKAYVTIFLNFLTR